MRLATESQMERNQKQIRQGREEMKRYQSESEHDDAADDEDGNSDDEAGGGKADSGRPKSQRRKSKRQNRSVFSKSLGTVELREQITYARQCAAVCGVPESAVSQLNQILIPAVPAKIGGHIKVTAT